MAGERVVLGVIAGAHGVRGHVRIKSFTERPEDLVAYGPLADETGASTFEITLAGQAKGVLIARIAGVNDRSTAEALKGTRLSIARSALPATEDEETFYYTDLIGLRVEDMDGKPVGRVDAVHDFGGGPILEIERPAGDSLLVPFTKAAVPVVDLAQRRLAVRPPEEVTAEPDEHDGPDDDRGRI